MKEWDGTELKEEESYRVKRGGMRRVQRERMRRK
jgi:hypothetical protein